MERKEEYRTEKNIRFSIREVDDKIIRFARAIVVIVDLASELLHGSTIK